MNTKEILIRARSSSITWKSKKSMKPWQPPTLKTKAVTVFKAFCVLSVLWAAGFLRAANNSHPGYLPADGNLYSGAIVFRTGQTWDPQPVFQVLGGDKYRAYDIGDQEIFVDSVKLRPLNKTNNEDDQWWSRLTFRESKYYFVKQDDPALTTREWLYYKV